MSNRSQKANRQPRIADCPTCGKQAEVFREGGACRACGRSFAPCDVCSDPAVRFYRQVRKGRISLHAEGSP